MHVTAQEIRWFIVLVREKIIFVFIERVSIMYYFFKIIINIGQFILKN